VWWAPQRALSNLMLLGRSVILDVDYLHLWTLEAMEGLMIQGQAASESGRCDGRFNRTPSSVKKSEARQGRRGGIDHDV
jgi:hypothetical protein